MNYQAFKRHIHGILKRELPKDLYYHSYEHVLDVYQSTIRLANAEGINVHQKGLLYTAVFLHDIGFKYGIHKGHEKRGCGIAREMLPAYGYDAGQIDHICELIMSTKIPQTPYGHLGEIICDADLDYLGRDDFDEISNELFKEMKTYGLIDSLENWNRVQVDFISNHHYFTETARKTREAKKQQHLNKLKEIVASYD